MISDASIDEVRRAADIVEVAGELGLPLKRAGSGWKALCPFHDDHTPSLSLAGRDARDPARANLFMCFSCKAAGNVLQLVQRVEAVPFNEAVERLARRYGVDLEEDEDGRERRQRRAALSQALDDAAEWWQAELYAHDEALSWLYGRGIDDDDIDRWRIGWAPADGGVVAATGAPAGVLEAASLVTVTRRGPIDFFTGRVMFPIRGEDGATVAAAGRALDDASQKYINSRASYLYDKSRTLYGLFEGRQDIVRADRALVQEGYTDVIASHRVGAPTAVATCGTALTEHHLRLLARRAKTVGLCFDADTAGADAALRLVGWQPKIGVTLEVVGPFPAGQDPAKVAETDPEGLRTVLEQPGRPLTGWAVDRALAERDASDTPEGKAAAVAAAVELADAAGPVVAVEYRARIAEAAGVDPADLGERAQQPTRTRTRTSEGPDPHDVDLLNVAAHHPEWVDGFIDPALFADPDCWAAVLELAGGKTLDSPLAVAAGFAAPVGSPVEAIQAAAVEAGLRAAERCEDSAVVGQLLSAVAGLRDVDPADVEWFGEALGALYGAFEWVWCAAAADGETAGDDLVSEGATPVIVS